MIQICGVEQSGCARRSHKPKVVGSNPTPATKAMKCLIKINPKKVNNIKDIFPESSKKVNRNLQSGSGGVILVFSIPTREAFFYPINLLSVREPPNQVRLSQGLLGSRMDKGLKESIL